MRVEASVADVEPPVDSRGLSACETAPRASADASVLEEAEDEEFQDASSESADIGQFSSAEYSLSGDLKFSL